MITTSAVVDLYQTPSWYWCPGVTSGAQDWFSCIIALRSPVPACVIVICIALPTPFSVSELVANVATLLP